MLSAAFYGACGLWSGEDVDDTLSDVIARELPEWKEKEKERPNITVPGGIGGKPTISGNWIDGKRTLYVSVVINDQPEEEFRWFFMRQIIPPNRSLSGIGKKASLVETGQSAEIGFAKENLFVRIEYRFPRPPGKKIGSIYVETAPKEEVEKVIHVAQILDKAISGRRTMTACYNDFYNPTFPRPNTDPDKLLAASLNGDTNTVKILLSSGVSPSAVDKDGNAALHLAVRSGCLDAIRALIVAKADVNARNHKLETPLMIAADSRYIRAVQLLLASGADANARDKYGNNSAFYSIGSPHYYYLFPQLFTREGTVAQLRLLKDAGLDLNAHNDLYGDTLLTITAGYGGDPTEQWSDLIDLGVDVNGTDVVGETALLKTVRSSVPDDGRIKIIKFLLAHDSNVNIKDKNGFTAIDYLRQERIQRVKSPEWVQNIDETIKLLETAQVEQQKKQ